KEIRLVLSAFIGSVLIASICSVIYLLIHPVHNIREISLFISHIRFSLCLDLGIVLALHNTFKEKENPLWLKIIFLVIAIWFTLYLFIAQTLTGIVLLLILAIVYLLYVWQQHHQNNSIKWVAYSIAIFLFLVSGYLLTITYQYFHLKEPDSSIDQNIKTQQGNEYAFDNGSIIENGSRIGNYVCNRELQEAWQTKSHEAFDPITEATLIRFLNSKGLRKDAQSVYTLSDKEIQYIENNIANIDYTRHFGIKRSLYPIFFSFSLYQKSGEINESTLLQRIELWKTSLEIIQQHPWLGVGIGDQKEELNLVLLQHDSAMKEKKDYGCHNQFLTYWLIGGIGLLLYFIFTLVAPFFYSTKKLNFLYLSFFIIMIISMLTEDTLETQAGITLYAFFNSFFLFIYGNSNKQSIITNKKITK
ncbi:MAG: O-antigen ligase family protein, partial [Bacteroidales bacterium]